MPTISQTPVYNLKAVLKETGLKADVLRAWERRYAIIQPQRTPGGHRLYSEHDIAVIQWLRQRQAEGLSISHAVALWHETLDAGRDPLEEYSAVNTPAPMDRLPAADTRIEILRQGWLDAVLAFDSLKADELLNQAFAIYPVETVCRDILQQGLSEIGDYWYQHKASPQQEHFASALASRRLEALLTATPHPTRQQTILIGCPPGEQHTFPVLLLSLLLRRRGLNIVYLGADIPVEQLEETAGAIKPDLIILAAQHLVSAASLRMAALTIQAWDIPVAYGGLIFNRIPELRQRIPAHFLGDTLDEAIQKIERLVIAPAPPALAVEVETHYTEAGKLYREKRLQIEAAFSDEMRKRFPQSQHMGEANLYFGTGLPAALELGDPAYLEADMEWIKTLLSSRHIPPESLHLYLAAYNLAVRSVLGEAGTPITTWIDSFLRRSFSARQ